MWQALVSHRQATEPLQGHPPEHSQEKQPQDSSRRSQAALLDPCQSHTELPPALTLP